MSTTLCTSEELLCGAIRRSDLLERVCGDEEVMLELVELGLTECPRLLQALRAAVAAGDAHTIERAAHALKGVAGNLAADEAFELALEMEQAARAEDTLLAASFLPRIEAAMQRVDAALSLLCTEKG
ncbi:MAG: Hpt domain-containing protein [Gemmataceae bacterium]